MKDYRFKIDNLELRSVDENLLTSKPHITLEINRWEGESCYTIAYWRETDEGYYLKYVTGRPFAKGVNADDFRWLTRIGQIILNRFRN